MREMSSQLRPGEPGSIPILGHDRTFPERATDCDLEEQQHHEGTQ